MEGLVLNYTQHPIVVYDKQHNGSIIATIESHGALFCADGGQAKLDTFEVAQGVTVDVITAPRFVRVTSFDLLDKARGHHIIVGMPVGEFLKTSSYGVTDQGPNGYGILSVLGPDTGPKGAVRDEQGRIIGTTRFVRYV